MEVQQEVSSRRLQRKVGRTLEVLIDEVDRSDAGGAVGRSSADAPDIDGLVYVNGNDALHDLQPGDRIQVVITAADEYDLYGEPVDAV